MFSLTFHFLFLTGWWYKGCCRADMNGRQYPIVYGWRLAFGSSGYPTLHKTVMRVTRN